VDSFAPIPFLRDLRNECLARSKWRTPKWKFRLASDLVMQLQPKPARGIKTERFEGAAVMVATGNATAEMLASRPTRRRNAVAWWRRNFVVSADAWNEWHLRIGAGMHTGNRADGDPVLVWRIRSALIDGFFTAPTSDAFLGNYCLICGRPLTDEASIARRIGPECAGDREVREVREVLWTEVVASYRAIARIEAEFAGRVGREAAS
jgi:hypothetical protein